ncbi:MAG: prolyl oligopeptidase family serine peptidase, partial [archaeon]|nr:prolyl oligopeptidase family serine peptidase [archaeon]
MARADRLGSFVLSPDRTKVAFTRRVWNVLLNRSSTTLYVLTVLPQAGLPEAVTPPAWGVADSDPNWSADGAFLLFLSNRLYNASSSNSGLIGPDPSGDRQIWQLRLSTGDLSRVSSFPLPLSALLVSPDSSSAAFAISLIPGTSIIQTAQSLSSSSSSLSSCPTFSSLSFPAAALPLPSTAGAQYRVYDQLMVRHWDQWATRCRSHVFLQRLSYHPSAQGFSLPTSSQPIDVVEASPSLLPFASDVPTFDGGREEWSFSPDGMRFAFTVHQDDSTTRHAFSTDLNVYLYDLSSRVLSCVSCANPAADSSPSFSPDGSTLSYLAMTVPGYESDRRIPTLYSLSSSTTSSSDPHPLPLTADWPSSPHQLMWRSSSHLIATTLQSGRHRLFLLDTNSPTPANTDNLTAFFSGGSVDVVGSGSGADEEVLVLAMSSFLHPTELFLLKGGQLQQVTHFSRLLCAKAGLDRVEMAVSDSSDIARLSFSGADDETVEGWYLRGARKRGAQRMPLAVLIHGGPQGSWADGWSYRWNPAVFASRGYCVALIDFHGSTGYGQGFTDSIRADYGGKPFLDMEKGVEHVLARYSFEVDPSNLHALGASYGGYMVNWLNGHSLQQYRSLVVHDGIFSLHSLFYETDELWFPSHDLLGTPWDSPDPSSPCFPQTCYSKW